MSGINLLKCCCEPPPTCDAGHWSFMAQVWCPYTAYSTYCIESYPGCYIWDVVEVAVWLPVCAPSYGWTWEFISGTRWKASITFPALDFTITPTALGRSAADICDCWDGAHFTITPEIRLAGIRFSAGCFDAGTYDPIPADVCPNGYYAWNQYLGWSLGNMAYPDYTATINDDCEIRVQADSFTAEVYRGDYDQFLTLFYQYHLDVQVSASV